MQFIWFSSCSWKLPGVIRVMNCCVGFQHPWPVTYSMQEPWIDGFPLDFGSDNLGGAGWVRLLRLGGSNFMVIVDQNRSIFMLYMHSIVINLASQLHRASHAHICDHLCIEVSTHCSISGSLWAAQTGCGHFFSYDQCCPLKQRASTSRV